MQIIYSSIKQLTAKWRASPGNAPSWSEAEMNLGYGLSLPVTAVFISVISVTSGISNKSLEQTLELTFALM